MNKYIPRDGLTKIKKYTGSLYNHPPAVWLRKTYTGEPGKEPKITDLETVILHHLYLRTKYIERFQDYRVKHSVKGLAKVLGKEPKQIRKGIARLVQSGAVKTEPAEKGYTWFILEHFPPENLKPILEELGLDNYF